VNSKFLAIQLPNQTKKNRIMKKRNITLLTAFAAAAALAPTAQADVITAPIDGYTGDYRLIYATPTHTVMTGGTSLTASSDITFYNGLVAADAATVTELNALGVDWNVVGSTATVNADFNTGTEITGPTDVRIYTLNGIKVADNYADLWDGSIDTRIQDGTGADTTIRRYTGTDRFGKKRVGNELGNGFDTSRAKAEFTDNRWIEDNAGSDNGYGL
jgi:hypothetical protein